MVGVKQVGGADLFDVKEIILCRHLAERHNLDAVGLSVRRVEKQVFKIPIPFESRSASTSALFCAASVTYMI